MRKMQELSALLNAIKNQNPSSKNAQQFVNNHLMRATMKKNYSVKKPSMPEKKQNPHSRKIIQESRIKQLDKGKAILLRQLYESKCKNLCISLIESKFNEFLQIFSEKNKEDENFLDLSDLNLVHCQKQINNLIVTLKVTRINLSQTVIEPRKLMLSQVKILQLNNCNLGSQQIQNLFDELLKYNQIEHLSLSSPEITNRNHLTRYEKLYELIQNCNSLRQLMLSNCSIHKENSIFHHLKNSSLRVIDLSYNQKVVGMSPLLQVLNLQGNEIIRPDAMFNNECRIRNELKVLNLSGNPIQHYDFKIFLKASYLCNIKQLKLKDILINQECYALQEFLSSSNTLASLNLVNCQLNQDSWMNVIFGLKCNYFIQEINLSKNILPTQDVAKAFSDILPNSSLKKLNMSFCSISDEFGALIFGSLSKNKLLQELDVSRNKIGNKTGMSLALVLKTNQALKNLNIKDNCINYLISKELMEYISRNKYLEIRSISKEYECLLQTQKMQKVKKEELLRIEKYLQQIRREQLQVKKKVYVLKEKKIKNEMNQLKEQIHDIVIQQNTLALYIEDLQADLYEENIKTSPRRHN